MHSSPECSTIETETIKTRQANITFYFISLTNIQLNTNFILLFYFFLLFSTIQPFLRETADLIFAPTPNIIILIMLLMISSEKKIWLPEEDQILKRLYEDDGLRNWSMIAKKMSSELSVSRKSAKQCRERYENHINTDTAKLDWTLEEELMLIQFHNQIGNKWALIAQKIPGKSDNSVKNHFYSKLRKVLRKLNTVIHTYLRRQFREININVIYKIVEACEEMFKDKPNCQQNTSRACREVQNKMLHLSMLKEEQFDSEERIEIYRQVIKEIYTVSKLYKRKSKKSRNHSIQAPNNKVKRKKDVIVVSNKHMDGYQSDSSSAFEGEEEEEEEEEEPVSNNVKIQEKQEKPLGIPYTIHVARPKKKEGVIVQEQEQGIKDLLKDAGLLQYEKPQHQPHQNVLKCSSRSSFKSYSQKNDSDHQFFEDSDVEKGFFSHSRKNSCFRNIGDVEDRSEAADGGQQGEQFYFN